MSGSPWVSDDPDKYGPEYFVAGWRDLPPPFRTDAGAAGTRRHSRGHGGHLRSDLRSEKRRRRKRGLYPDPDKRVLINELVCEGCGDCGKASNCVSVQPV